MQRGILSQMIAESLLAIATAYLLGTIHPAYVIGRVARGIDVREIGDRNLGATNVFRQFGPLAGAATALVDIGKGAVAALLARAIPVPDGVVILVGLAVVAGHVWPFWLGFRGGGGFATALGVVIAVLPRESALLLVPYAIFALTIGRRIGVGLASAPLLPAMIALALILGEPPAFVALPAVMGGFIGIRRYGRELCEWVGGIVRS